MSSFVFPTLAVGPAYDVIRTPLWDTQVQTALSGKRSTLARRVYPLIHFELIFNLLRDDITTSDLKAIVGLFNNLQGRYDTFLFQDPDFNTVTAMQFGTGDGTTPAFQVTATYQNTGGPGYPELIQNFNGTPSIYKNGTLQTLGTNYTISGTGVVTFTSAPAAAAVLAWTGSFYYRCAFDQDKLDLAKFMSKWWAIKKLPFTSVKL